MFADLDETIKQLLVREVPLDLTEVEVSFDAPDREWSGRLSRPAVNCFLYDVRENTELRQSGWNVTSNNGRAFSEKPPLRFDVTYQITCWARAPEDEHRLLWRVLAALARNLFVPEDLLHGSLKEQPFAIPANTAQPGETRGNPADLWQAVDNRIRPAVTYVLTVALDPRITFTSPLVFTRVARVREMESGEVAQTYRVGGLVRDRTDPARLIAGALIRIKEAGVEATSDDEGRFSFRRSVPGPITLEVLAPDRTPTSRRFEVPSQSYDVEV